MRARLLLSVTAAVLAIAGNLASAVARPPAQAATKRRSESRLPAVPQAPLRAVGRYLEDPAGRVVILHGLFAVWKQPPYYPAGIDDASNPSTPSFTEADAQRVQALGLDAARLSWYWEGLEPNQGSYSAAYLNGIAGAEAQFAARHVYVVLDAHQDQYNELFGNKPGFPLWSAISDGEPVAPQPSDAAYSSWKFPLGYFHPSTELAFGNLYANRSVNGEGIRTAFARAWQAVVRRFRSDPMVAGYDIINEPFPGTASIANPYVSACSSQPGCPSFDRHTLEPFQVAIARAIRRFDRSRPVFFEPTFYFNGGTPTHFGTPPAEVRPVGLSFHNQCPTRTAYSITHDPALIITGHTSCPPVSAQVFHYGLATAGMLGGPGLMTEVASTSDNDAEGLNCQFEQADHFQTGYTYGLSWSNPNDELRRLDEESGPTGVAPFKELVLARVYPRAVAGDPQSYGFDVRTGRFWLLYRARPRVRAPTVISIPTSVQYPGGYTVRVTGARQVSAADAQRLELVNDAHSGTVSVVVTPATGSGISRPQFRACQLDPTSASG